MADASVNEAEIQHNALTYNDIAKKLLKDKLLLTALELHTELIESGKEIRQLKDFFSNPGNFEVQSQEIQSHSSRISRSGSQTTLDSLDFTRYSEDGERGSDDRLAVLEFELRKAKETISALRNNLTVATESEKSTPDKSLKITSTGNIKPHEQRALNFLINEYLLLHGYKLTSITFGDENENQDFEDWDDVGLNISKPAELLTLYREGLKQTGHHLKTTACQTDVEPIDNNIDKKLNSLHVENDDLKIKNTYLESQLSYLTKENVEIESKIKQYELSSHKVNDTVADIKSNFISSSKNSSTVGSDSPEHFELIEKSNLSYKNDDTFVEDNVSNNSLNVNEWAKISVTNREQDEIKKADVNLQKNILNNKYNSTPEKFMIELCSLCPTNIPIKLENELMHILNQAATNESFIMITSEALLKLIPNIILNKREDAIPLLMSAVHLNPDSNVRDKLLQQLFNLKKKPSESERAMILLGITGIAKFAKESIVENEVLPQCWEQLTHKHVERRLLVAESCRVLTQYVSAPIRNSLMLSMLQQMLEDREEIVRETVIRALAIIVASCDDIDKYNQCEELATNTLKDGSVGVVNLSVQILFPVIAKWALEIGRLMELIRNLLHRLSDTLKVLKSDSPSKLKHSPEVILNIINVINKLLPFVAICVANNEIILNRIEKDTAFEMRPEFLNMCTNITNPNIFCNSQHNVGMILYEFDRFIEEDNLEKWPELEWLVDIVFPDLLNSLNHIDLTQHELIQAFINLFSNCCVIFGKNFTTKKIRPLFQTHVQNLEQILSSFNQFSPSLNVIPVYLVSILSFCDIDEVSNVLKRFLCALPLCGTPLDCLEITVKGLCNLGLQEIVVASLWEGVVHPRPLVRGVTAGLFATIISLCNEVLLNTKVTPALVTLANDSDILVRTATVPALGSLITDCAMEELHDKSYMQLQMFLADPVTKENHTLLRQLVVTMGHVVITCKASFRQDFIIPQLTGLCAYMYQMSSQTRKIDMSVALIEAFSNVIYSPVQNNTISNIVIPALRYLEQAVNENQTLQSHRDAVLSMIKECENRLDMISPQTPTDKTNKISQNVNQGVEEMKQRVSKIFNKPPGIIKPTNLPNLQGFFKKKSLN